MADVACTSSLKPPLTVVPPSYVKYVESESDIASYLQQAYKGSLSKSFIGSRFYAIGNCNAALTAVTFQLLGRIAYVFQTVVVGYFNLAQDPWVGVKRVSVAFKNCRAPWDLFWILSSKSWGALLYPKETFNDFENLTTNLKEQETRAQAQLLALDEQLQSKTAEIKEYETKIQETKTALTQLNICVERYQKVLNETESKRATTQEHCTQLATTQELLQIEVKNLSAEKTILEQNTLLPLRQELKITEEQLSEKKSALKAANEAKQTTQMSLEKLLEQLNAATQQLSIFREEEVQLRKTLDYLTQEQKTKQINSIQFETQIQQLQLQSEMAKQEVTELNARKEELNQAIATHTETTNGLLNSSIKPFSDQIENEKKNAEELAEKNTKISITLEEATKKLHETLLTIQEKEKVLQNLEKEIAGKTSVRQNLEDPL